MARPAVDRAPLTPEKYLELELTSLVKHEFVGGHLYAMTGTSDAHNLILGNLYLASRTHLRGSPCRVFMSDLKARIRENESFDYPDLMVSCEQAVENYYRECPSLIVEVLSPSTAQFDAQDKRHDYQRLESLREYVLISQECMDVRVYRGGESGWDLSIHTDGALIHLASVGLQLPIERLYDEVWE